MALNKLFLAVVRTRKEAESVMEVGLENGNSWGDRKLEIMEEQI